METLILYTGLSGDSARWLSDDGGQWQGTLAQAAQAARGKRVIWLLPGEQTLLLLAQTPARSRKELQQAVPFTVEDELASDLEGNLLVFERTDQGVAVLVAEREALERRHRQLLALGIRARQISCDVLALPWQSSSWSLLLDGERAVVRVGATQGWACERDNLEWMLEQHLAGTPESERPHSLRYWGDPGFKAPQGLTPQAQAETGIQCLQAGAAQMPALDLGTVLHAAGLMAQADRRRFAVALGVAALACVLALGSLAWEQQRLAQYNQRLGQKIEDLYRQTFPEARKVVKPRFQMQQGLQRLEQGGGDEHGFLGRLAALAPAVTGNGALLSLSYQGDALSLRVRVPDLQAVDALKQRLEGEAGQTVAIQSVDKQPEGVFAVLRLRGGQA